MLNGASAASHATAAMNANPASTASATVTAATAAMNGNAPMSTRLLSIEPNANCEGGMMLGLTHQRQNLECALQLAALTGRKLQVAPLHEHRRHTRCAASHATAWSSIVSLEGEPATTEAHAFSPHEVARHALDVTPEGLARVRNSPAPMVELTLGHHATYCNYYQACIALPASADGFPPVPPSNSVRAAAAEIAARLGGGAYDGVHIRQADKTQESMEEIRLPELTPRSLTRRLKRLFNASASAPPPSSSSAAASSAAAAVYVATDAPALLKAPCVGACFRAHTWADFAAAAAARAPDAVTRGEAQGCMPYWVTAVEQEVLLNARSVVLSETSNFARTVAVERRRRRGPEALRLLMTAATYPPLPKNATVGALELAFFEEYHRLRGGARRRDAHSQQYRTLLPQVGWELRLPAAPEAAPLRAILYAKDAGDDERCERARSCDEI